MSNARKERAWLSHLAAKPLVATAPRAAVNTPRRLRPRLWQLEGKEDSRTARHHPKQRARPLHVRLKCRRHQRLLRDKQPSGTSGGVASGPEGKLHRCPGARVARFRRSLASAIFFVGRRIHLRLDGTLPEKFISVKRETLVTFATYQWRRRGSPGCSTAPPFSDSRLAADN